MALTLTDKEKIINYIMNTPYNTNWGVLSTMLGEGDWSKLKQYIEITPKNMNKKVLESLLTITEPIDEDYRTVLYTDGTLIINESSRNEAANVALHGQPTNVYAPFDPNGATDAERYIFTNPYGDSRAPWLNYDSDEGTFWCNVLTVEIGSMIQPTSTAYWFYRMQGCRGFDFTNLDTSAVTNMEHMFSDCVYLASLDLSNFDTSAVTNMESMFNNCNSLTTIYASENFVTAQVTSSNIMFGAMSTNLVGGAGTVWSSSNPTDKTYAHIDGGISNPGYFTAK